MTDTICYQFMSTLIIYGKCKLNLNILGIKMYNSLKISKINIQFSFHVLSLEEISALQIKLKVIQIVIPDT